MPGVLVLIPSYNVASTIAYVVSTAAQGLKKFFPEYENMILVSDGGSIDGTVDVVKSLRIEDVKISVERYKGVSGKGSATIYGFKKALENDYDAVIMLDSDLRSIEPWWIKLLGEATKKYDLVTPIYVRDKWDGTITKTLAYPTIKSVFKAEIRQPIGGDFGISRRLLEKAFENVELFTLDVYKFGIDFFITSTAVSENMRIAQADLGSKIHAAKDPGLHLKDMFFNVSKIVVQAILNYWNKIRYKGFTSTEILKWKYSWRCPQYIEVDVKANVQRFVKEYKKNKGLFEKLLREETSEIDEIVKNLTLARENAFPDELWARLFFKNVAKFREYGEEVAETLYVLWLGKVASYLIDTIDKNVDEAEKYVESIAKAFTQNIEILKTSLNTN